MPYHYKTQYKYITNTLQIQYEYSIIRNTHGATDPPGAYYGVSFPPPATVLTVTIGTRETADSMAE